MHAWARRLPRGSESARPVVLQGALALIGCRRSFKNFSGGLGALLQAITGDHEGSNGCRGSQVMSLLQGSSSSSRRV